MLTELLRNQLLKLRLCLPMDTIKGKFIGFGVKLTLFTIPLRTVFIMELFTNLPTKFGHFPTFGQISV